MPLTRDIANHVRHFEIDQGIVALLQKQMMDPDKVAQNPRDYFYVTQLVNPTQTYWDKITGGMSKPPELRRKLAKGKRLQDIASNWFQILPDFVVESGKLDGALVGLRGVRGELDYVIGQSIIELKTKDRIPLTPAEVITDFSQDLEQLMIYSVMHPENPVVNYLVFMSDTKPYKFATFRVEIKNQDQIRRLVENRIKLLKKAINEKDSSQLGRCRYYGKTCQYENGVCDCKNMSPIENSLFDSAIELKFDKEFNDQIESARDKSAEKESDWFTTWEVLNPRLHYLDRILGERQEYSDTGFDKDAYEACIWSAIKKLNFGLSLTERSEIYSKKRESRIKVGFHWLKIPHSGKNEYQTLPFIYKVSSSGSVNQANTPNEYHLAQLGVICATYGVSRGLIIALYPKLNKQARVFQIDFDGIGEIQEIIKRRLDDCEAAENVQKPLLMDPCPDFINSGKTCPMTRVCHSEKGSGCIPGLFYPQK